MTGFSKYILLTWYYFWAQLYNTWVGNVCFGKVTSSWHVWTLEGWISRLDFRQICGFYIWCLYLFNKFYYACYPHIISYHIVSNAVRFGSSYCALSCWPKIAKTLVTDIKRHCTDEFHITQWCPWKSNY